MHEISMQFRLAYNIVRWRFGFFSATRLPTLLCLLFRASHYVFLLYKKIKHVKVIGTLIGAMYEIWPQTTRSYSRFGT